MGVLGAWAFLYVRGIPVLHNHHVNSRKVSQPWEELGGSTSGVDRDFRPPHSRGHLSHSAARHQRAQADPPIWNPNRSGGVNFVPKCRELKVHVLGPGGNLHPTLYALHPTPYTLHPTPYTPHPTPQDLNPEP